MSLPAGAEIAVFLQRWFAERGVDLSCAACGRCCWQPTQYGMLPFATGDCQLVIDEADTTEANAQPLLYLLLPVYCKNCGYMVFFNAGMMGNMPSYFPEQVIEIEDSDQTM